MQAIDWFETQRKLWFLHRRIPLYLGLRSYKSWFYDTLLLFRSSCHRHGHRNPFDSRMNLISDV